MADVARLAGVNPSTVSHVLNGTRAVSGPTREAVLAAVERTGYRQNTLARSLARSATTTLGLASGFVANPHLAALVTSVERAARAAGYTLVLADTHDDPAEELRVLHELAGRRVDGVVLAPSARAAEEALPFLAGSRLPTVLLDRFADAPLDQVGPEGSAATEALTAHLLDLGHRRTAFVAGLEGLSSTTERRDGYLRAVAARGLAPLVLPGASDTRTAEEVVTAAFSAPGRPTAVVVGNNSMTVGTLRALRALGLRLPADVALVCYDDPEWADLVEPRLTALAQDVPAMATRAVQMILERIAGSDAPPRRERVAPTLRHRDSCCAAGDPARG
ncbi:LacI family DNA-binding transcriptional regulator [Kineococcus vitellinus]|uniref:LacI family DNA-binding transcriptional regulator n=1 Tax=Kineococcus vitellinus TaxID=2696565 RepID=UPI001F1015A0|nr:LacI family DNA-binding transcriptional regulator [Kineococcus vitellinus]